MSPSPQTIRSLNHSLTGNFTTVLKSGRATTTAH